MLTVILSWRIWQMAKNREFKMRPAFYVLQYNTQSLISSNQGFAKLKCHHPVQIMKFANLIHRHHLPIYSIHININNVHILFQIATHEKRAHENWVRAELHK